jgi:lysylphosphatidylglycerol synthetase-like protein (DUF2156 family)
MANTFHDTERLSLNSEQKLREHFSDSANGPFAAMVLAAGIGSSIFGMAVVLASASPTVKNFLNWWNPAGPLVGKTSFGVLAWLFSWAILHFLWRERELPLKKVWVCSLILISIGFVLTFPPAFEWFEKH